MKSKFSEENTTQIIEEIDTNLMGHEVDGIRELDNDLPRWWVHLFQLTVVVGVIYFIGYHITGSWDLQEAEYSRALAKFSAKTAPTPVPTAEGEESKALTDAESLSRGKEIYIKNCAPCHGKHGQGLIGPNMTDAYWIHGGSYQDIVRTVTIGVPAKGMVPWKSILGAQKIEEVSSYIMTLAGTNPDGAKKAEGTLYKP